MFKKLLAFILLEFAAHNLFAAGDVTFRQGSGGGTVTIQQATGSGGGGSSVSAAYGAIYLSSGSVTQANVSTTPVKLSIFNVDGISAQTAVSSANDSITVTTTSVFNVFASAFQVDSGSLYDKYYNICVNGSTQPISSKVFTASNIPITIGGVLSLTNGDVVTLCARTSSTTVGVPLSFNDAQLVVSAVGGSGGSGGSGGGGLPLTPGDTNYIQNSNTLQSGSTFYVSSGTVYGNNSFYLIGEPGSAGGSSIRGQFTQMPSNGGFGPQVQNAIFNALLNNDAGEFAVFQIIASTVTNFTYSSPHGRMDIGATSVGFQANGYQVFAAAATGASFNNDISIYSDQLYTSDSSEIKFYESQDNGPNEYVAYKASSTIASAYTVVLPQDIPSIGQVMTASVIDGATAYFTYQTPSAGGGGSSSLAVGTGTASSFTNNITSPTAAISFLGSQFNSVANGTTNFMTLNLSSVTVEGKLVAGSNITLTPGVGTLTIASSGGGGGVTGSTAPVTFGFSGGGSVISAGVEASTVCVPMTYGLTISSWTVIAPPPSVSGSISVTIRKASFANFPTFSAMSAGGNPPSLSSSNKNAATPASWTSTSLSAGDTVCAEVTSATSVTRAVITLWGIR